MNYIIGNNYEGFELIEQRKIEEVNGIGRLFTHKKSGAKLYNIENNDDNKVFSIAFRTPVNDSTGVAHIIEHSVLCGSDKFPVKEPFIELAKGSLNTFLNAMTFPDKTMYPVASKNERDFFNLMDVYLDAVLKPNIYKYKEIFMQEGWHYELDNLDNPITYKGVVLNEMKGAFSSPESILSGKVMESLFPNTNYKFESGGDPDCITNLTYEGFIDFHKKYYHPSNSFIYLYGNGDLIKELAFINDNYLKNYSSRKINSEIIPQNSFTDIKELKSYYPITQDESIENKTFLTLNYVCGKNTESEDYIAMDILEYILLETPASPLKRALIDNKIGKDVYGSYDSSIYQPIFNITVRNSSEEKVNKFKEVVSNTFNQLIVGGIDKSLIEASINYTEFRLREADYHGYPNGLIYNMKVMDSWLYGGKPEIHLEYEETLKKIKASLNSNYFEKLIKKYIINNKHVSLVILSPQKGLAENREKDIEKELYNFKKSLNKEQLINIMNETRKLKERQNSSDSIEDMQTLPLLSLEDISKVSEIIPQNITNENGITILHQPLFTNKIAYVNIYFDISVIPEELLPYTTLIASLLGKLSTQKYTYEELSNEINIHTGGIKFSVETFMDNKEIDKYSTKFCIRTKSTYDKVPKLMEIIKEIVTKSDFLDSKRIKEIIDERKSRLEMVIIESGHILAVNRIMSQFSLGGHMSETLAGLSHYQFISEIDKNYNLLFTDINNKLVEICNLLFNSQNVIVGITCAQDNFINIKDNVTSFVKSLYSISNQKHYSYNFNLCHANEALIISSKVQYVAKGYNYKKLGYNYLGCMQVLKTILGFDYLWNKVRVYGGAYGAFANFQYNGNMYFVSYRDPNLKETIVAYDNSYKYIADFDVDEREMSKYIIGTISRIDSPMSVAMNGMQSEEFYIRNITNEDIQTERNEVLGTKTMDIRKLSAIIKELMQSNYLCVVGEENKIKSNKNLFENIINVIL